MLLTTEPQNGSEYERGEEKPPPRVVEHCSSRIFLPDIEHNRADSEHKSETQCCNGNRNNKSENSLDHIISSAILIFISAHSKNFLPF